MKKIIFSAVSALALASFAADSTQFGVLTVPSSAAQTIVSVPWLASSTNDTAVKVADLVLTAGLNVNDELKYYNGTKYECWTLEKGEDDVKHWVASTTVSSEGVGTVAAEQDATLARGRAIILKRGEPIASQFYIMGKPATSSVGAITLPEGSKTSPVYALVAPPTTSAANINKEGTWSGLTQYKDRLLIDRNGTMEILTWTGTYWGSNSHPSGGEITIPVGQGAWFVSYGTGTKTVTW